MQGYTVVDFLEQAKGLINTPDKWTTKASARDKDGNKIEPDDLEKGPVCYCSLGALWRTRYEWGQKKVPNWLNIEARARCILEKAVPTMEFVYEYNDTSSHPAVMQMFDKAIELAKELNV